MQAQFQLNCFRQWTESFNNINVQTQEMSSSLVMPKGEKTDAMFDTKPTFSKANPGVLYLLLCNENGFSEVHVERKKLYKIL